MNTNDKAGPTPGPWTYGWVGEVGEPSLGYPCVGTSGPHDWVGPKGAESDARLIAAAPDLLAACEAVIAWVEDESDDVWGGLGDASEKVRAAIAKAWGAS